MDTKPHRLEPARLLLDPNNYRFHDVAGYKQVSSKSRYGEQGVQDRALQLLQSTDSFDLRALRDSILTNGFVPIEQIVVEKYSNEDNPTYLVIEGNRRVAAVKSLLTDFKAGAVDIDQKILSSLETLPVIEIVGNESEKKDYQQTLMAIRHVEYPIYGVQFHPESILTEGGKTLLRNFLSLQSKTHD